VIPDSEIIEFTKGLSDVELEYTRAFADFVSVGSLRPDVPAAITVARAAEIRAAIMQAWARVVWRRRR
jgi:hypothetical protein